MSTLYNPPRPRHAITVTLPFSHSVRLSGCLAQTNRATTKALIAMVTITAMATPTLTYAASADVGIANAVVPNALVSNNPAPHDLGQQQQQAWQDTLNQQRIESLRQAQAAESSSDNLVPEATIVTPSTSVPLVTPPKLAVQPAIQPTIEQPITDTPVTACLSTQRIELADLNDLKSSVQAQLRAQAAQLSQSQSAPIEQTEQEATDAAQKSCISLTQANALVRQITEAYLDAGYFKIMIQPETVDKATSIDKPTSIWHIHVANIQAIDNQTALPTARLFGRVIGTPANIAWLDQAVSNGERLIDGQLLLDIYPVGRDGQDVRLKITQQGAIDSISSDLEWRYDPDDSYGHPQLKLHTTLRNVLGQADLTSLSVQQSLANDYGYDADNQRRSASVYSIIPNGRWQWSGFVAADESKRTTLLPNSVLTQTGETWQANLRGDYTLSRNQHSITTLYGQLAHQAVSSDLLGSQLDIQSPTLSSGRLGMTHTKLFNKRSATQPNKTTSGAWVLDVSGEKAFGDHDNPATKAGLSDDYWRWLVSGYVSHQHTLLAAKQPLGYWQMTHELQGQYSDDDLFGISQQSLGSTYAGVRGIDKVANSAASGLTLRNTLSFEPLQTQWLQVNSPYLGNQKIRWSPYIGADYGVLKEAGHASQANNTNEASGSEGESKAKAKRDTSDAVSGTLGITLTGYDVKGQGRIGSTLQKRWALNVGASRAHIDYSGQDSSQNGNQDTEVAASWQWFF